MYTDNNNNNNNNTAFKLKGDFLLLKKIHSGGLLCRIGGAVSSAG